MEGLGLKKLLAVIGSLFVFMSGDIPTPTEAPEGVTIISAADARPLFEQNRVQVFDMRKAVNYQKGHLPQAVSLPYEWTRKKGHPGERTGRFDLSRLPEDKEANLLFLSSGPKGWKSYHASIDAKKAGYRNIMWMREGFSGWSEKGYPVDH
jgi:rhodanese-related sulfurtransferase